jgi:hypothetical protein
MRDYTDGGPWTLQTYMLRAIQEWFVLSNLAIDDGHGVLGGRRFHSRVGQVNDENYPWVMWSIFQKL